MPEPQTAAPFEVEVSTFVAARPATIFRYFTDPERFSRWLAAEVRADPQFGGELRVDFRQWDVQIEGRFLELVPDRRVVFTWGQANGERSVSMPPGSSTVTVSLVPEGEGTRVTLRHGGLPSQDEARDHEGGWLAYLTQLGGLAGEEEAAEPFARAIELVFRAWNEPDAAGRDALLADCWADGGEHRDRFGSSTGRQALSDRIGQALAGAPGLRLVATGAAKVCQPFGLVPWQAVGPDEAAYAGGTNLVELAGDGRIARVVGFWD